MHIGKKWRNKKTAGGQSFLKRQRTTNCKKHKGNIDGSHFDFNTVDLKTFNCEDRIVNMEDKEEDELAVPKVKPLSCLKPKQLSNTTEHQHKEA